MSDEPRRLIFTKDGHDLTEGVELRNGRANPFGWSIHDVWLNVGEVYPGAAQEEQIAQLYCGEPIDLAPGISFRIEEAQPLASPPTILPTPS